MKINRIAKKALSFLLVGMITIYGLPNVFALDTADTADSWKLIAEETYPYAETEIVDAPAPDPFEEEDTEITESDADLADDNYIDDNYISEGNPFGATQINENARVNTRLRSLAAAANVLNLESVEVIYGGEVQVLYRPELITLKDGKYYTAQQNASVTDPRIFKVSATFENLDGAGAPLIAGDSDALYTAFLEKLKWTYGGKPLSDWKKSAAGSAASTFTGATPFITLTASKLYKEGSTYKLEAEIRFDTPLFTLANANPANNIPYNGYANTTQASGSNSFHPQHINALLGNYELSVRYDADDVIGNGTEEKTLGARPVKLTLYDSYLKWSEADAFARNLKELAESANGSVNGRYVNVESLAKTHRGNDIWNFVVSDSKASVDKYLNVTRKLMETDPAGLGKQVAAGEDHRLVLYFNVTHADETPGADANVNLINLLLYGNDFSFDSWDNLENTPYVGSTTGYTSRTGTSVTHHPLTVDEALKKFIFVINITSNPDGRELLLRGNDLGIDQNRQASGHVTIESQALAASIFKWSPVADNENHGYVQRMLLMPGSGPHAPYYEHDLLYPDALKQAYAMGQAILGSTALQRFTVPYVHYRDGWDDGATIYAQNFPVLFGAVGQNIEIPFANEDGVDAFLIATKALTNEYLKDFTRLFQQKMEVLRRAVENEDVKAVDQYLVNPYQDNAVVGRPRKTDANGEELSYFPDYYVIPVDEDTQFNVPEAYRTLEQLERNGAKYRRTTVPVEIEGVTYPAGTYVIDLRQYSRNYIHSVLDDGYDASFYNSTYAEITINLPALRGFKNVSLWDKGFFDAKSVPVEKLVKPDISAEGATEYVIVKSGSTDVVRLVNRLLNNEKPVHIVTSYVPEGNIGDFIVKSADLQAVKEDNRAASVEVKNDKLTAIVKNFPAGESGLARVTKPVKKPRIAGVGTPIAPNYPQGTTVTPLLFTLPFLEFTDYSITTNLGATTISNYNVIFSDNVNPTNLSTQVNNGIPYIGIRTTGVTAAASLTNFTLGARTATPSASEGVFRTTVLPTSSVASAFAGSEVSYFGTSSGSHVFFGTLPAGTKPLIKINDGPKNFVGGWWRNAGAAGYNYALTEGKVTAVYGLAGPNKNVPITLFGTNALWRATSQYYWPLISQAIFEGASGIVDTPRPFAAADTASKWWTNTPISVTLKTSASDVTSSSAVIAKQLAKVNNEKLEPIYSANDGDWGAINEPITISTEGESYIHWYVENSEAYNHQGTYGPYYLDLTAPRIKSQAASDLGSNVRLRAEAVDELSGVSGYLWQSGSGDGEWVDVTTGAIVVLSGLENISQSYFRVVVTDLAGNVTVGKPLKALKVLLEAEAEAGQVTARVENNTETALNGTVILAVYSDTGKLVYSENAPFVANGNNEFSYKFLLSTALYPLDKYSYKVFAWNSQFVPIADGALIE
ncbi:hypothetical protein FACS1894127_3880 [Clostridia bacterium]|nr:hypothetical protein FACS1894127_3880 [Clostridia bacterium]